GRSLGAIARDPEAEVLVRIATPRLDLGQELLRPVDLLEPPLPGRKPSLLLLQLLQGWMAVTAAHPRLLSRSGNSLPRPTSTPSTRRAVRRGTGRSGSHQDRCTGPHDVPALDFDPPGGDPSGRSCGGQTASCYW